MRLFTHRLALLTVVAVIATVPLAARADEPYLVKDIYEGLPSGDPGCLTNVDGLLYFTAYDGVRGPELWTSDGTAAGTRLIKDINPGPDGSGPCSFAGVGGTVFFSANDGVTGRELWKTDGTAAGTVLVKDIWPGDYPGAQSEPFSLTSVKRMLLFRANDGQTGWELWRSDGTAAGTVLVRDIAPGSASANNRVEPMTGTKGKVFFRAADPSHGLELWRSNGRPARTVLIKDINPGPAPGLPSQFLTLLQVGRTLYFPASDGAVGAELWKSNGRTRGTRLVKNLTPGVSGPFIVDDLTNADGRIFFDVCTQIPHPEFSMYDCDLWTSDGTEAGTVLVTTRGRLSAPPDRGSLASVGETLFFRGQDYTLWRTDGTTAGTVRVSDVFDPQFLTAVNDTVFFNAFDASHGYELWMSDGTAVGTTLAKDIWPGGALNESSYPQILTAANGTLFFIARDPDHGNELWAVHAPAGG